jgi:hypothetical protein
MLRTVISKFVSDLLGRGFPGFLQRWRLPFFPLVTLDWIVGLRFVVRRLAMLLMRTCE